MNMKKLQRMLACLLVAVMLLCTIPAGALAATYQKVYVKNESANLYKSATTAATVLRELPQNAVVTLGIAKSSWCYVKYDGTVGYMRTADLSASKVETDSTVGESSGTVATPAPETSGGSSSSSSTSGITAVITKTTKLYEHARTSASSYGTLYSGAKLVCLKVSGSWARVEYKGVTGYVPKSCLAKDTGATATPAPADPTPTPAPSAPETTPAPEQNEGSSSNGIRVTTVTASKFYKRPDTASGSLATVAKGKEFICLKVSGNWARVQIGNNIGYMLKNTLKAVGGSSDSSSETASPTPAPAVPSTAGSIICYLKAATPLYATTSTSGDTAASLEKGEKVLVMQVKSGWAKLYTQQSVLGYLPSSLLSKTPVAASPKVMLMDWFESDIQDIFGRGTIAKVVDVATGKAFNIKRTGGILHADVEPVSASDTETMHAVYGGQWSWDRRAIWVVIDGVYYAASMNGMGHGSDSSPNNAFDGIVCVHFLNSRTHETDNVCPLHQAAIKQAYNTKP